MWEEDAELWISRQIIREFLVQVTHPNTFSPALPLSQVMTQLEVMQSLFRVADETQVVTEQLAGLIRVFSTRGKQIHDANVVATMLAYEINTLLTLNIGDFRRYDNQIRLISIGETTG